MNEPSLDPPPLGEKGSNEITSQSASQPANQPDRQSASQHFGDYYWSIQGVSGVLFDDVMRHFPNPCEFPNYF